MVHFQRAILVILSFLIVEGAVRTIHYWVYPLYEDKTSLSISHPSFHHWHVADGVQTYRAATGEFTVRNRTNSYGMAGKEITHEKPKGVFRIAMLGDSFVEGFYAEEDKSIVNNLQTLLNQSSGRRFEVLNFGCSSFSPSLEYFNLVHLAHRFEPDMIVVMFHLTDVTDDWKYTHHSRQVVKSDGKVLGIDGTGDKGLWYSIAERSALLQAFVQSISKIVRSRELQEGKNLTESYDAMFKPEFDDHDYEAWKVSTSYLAKIKDQDTSSKKRLIFILC